MGESQYYARDWTHTQVTLTRPRDIEAYKEALALSRPALSSTQLDMARSLQSETVRMSAIAASVSADSATPRKYTLVHAELATTQLISFGACSNHLASWYEIRSSLICSLAC